MDDMHILYKPEVYHKIQNYHQKAKCTPMFGRI